MWNGWLERLKNVARTFTEEKDGCGQQASGGFLGRGDAFESEVLLLVYLIAVCS